MVQNLFRNSGLIPVIKINDPENAAPLAAALREGGINCAEITFRTPAAKDAIKAISREFPDMLVGAGTVITKEQLRSAEEAGAKFIVSPGLDADLAAYAADRGIPFLPGIVTPTELMAGLSLGLDTFKFFPAEIFGGVKAVLALAAPFNNVLFVPTGGIDEKNVSNYWNCAKVLAVGGSWIATERLIDGREFGEITRLCKDAVCIMESCGRCVSC